MSLRALLPALALLACAEKDEDDDRDDDTGGSGLSCAATLSASGAIEPDFA